MNTESTQIRHIKGIVGTEINLLVYFSGQMLIYQNSRLNIKLIANSEKCSVFSRKTPREELHKIWVVHHPVWFSSRAKVKAKEEHLTIIALCLYIHIYFRQSLTSPVELLPQCTETLQFLVNKKLFILTYVLQKNKAALPIKSWCFSPSFSHKNYQELDLLYTEYPSTPLLQPLPQNMQYKVTHPRGFIKD